MFKQRLEIAPFLEAVKTRIIERELSSANYMISADEQQPHVAPDAGSDTKPAPRRRSRASHPA
jgi:hypothetical protein